MANYNILFKFEPSKKNPFSYIVYRKNFSKGYQKVAEALITPCKKFNISYVKDLKTKEKKYIEDFFTNLVNLKIVKSKSNPFNYTIYRIRPSGDSERIALVYITTGFVIDSLVQISPEETLYIENCFKQLIINQHK